MFSFTSRRQQSLLKAAQKQKPKPSITLKMFKKHNNFSVATYTYGSLREENSHLGNCSFSLSDMDQTCIRNCGENYEVYCPIKRVGSPSENQMIDLSLL